MKVDSLDNITSIRRLRQKKTSAGGFSLPDMTEDSEIENIATSLKIPSLNPFLALQEVEGQPYERSEDEKLLEESELLIDYLKHIRIGLINGDLNIQNIRNLKDIIEKKKYSFNSLEAQKLYDEIYLRASVELAKLERSQNNPRE
jgi:hypothetical protein